MNKIDKTDQKIVNLLMEDGRMACAEIARRIGDTSERAVRYRINRLIREGFIQISAIVNPKIIGYGVMADVWLQVESDAIQEVAQRMAEYECVTYVAFAIGETDVSVQIVARSNEEAYRFVTEVIGRTPGVIKTTTSIIPNVLKDVYQWRIPASACLEDGAPTRANDQVD